MKVLLAKRVIDQVLQAQWHDDVEQRLDEEPYADESQPPLVIAQDGPGEAVDGGKRPCRLGRRERDEVLVILILIVEIDRLRVRHRSGRDTTRRLFFDQLL